MPSYGSLDIEEDEDKMLWYAVRAEHEVELMISRIIPSHKNYPLRVRVHPENTQLIRMVMREYPLDVKTPRWQEMQDEIVAKEKTAEILTNLIYAEPNTGHFIGELLPFQKQGLDFLNKTNGNALVTDDMGLGKTIETLAYIASNPHELPVVIIAPLVTLVNWKREIEKFLKLGYTQYDNQQTLFKVETHTPTINIIRSGEAKRIPPADFHIINYELLGKRAKDIADLNPQTVVMDEIQYLRNNDTVRYVACKFLCNYKSVKHRVGLSGTPIYNRGIEMYNITEIIKPGLLGDREEFVRRYCKRWNNDESTEEGKVGLSNLLRKSIMIRRKKTDVLKDLPDKIRMKQQIQIDTSLYEREIQKIYDKIDLARSDLSGLLGDEHKEGLFELNKKIREMRIQERQIAGLAKAPYVLKYLESLLEDYEDEKFVVFCHHVSVRQTLYNGLWRYKPVMIVGGQSDKDRQLAIDSFQNGKSNRVIICGLRAGNIGINLTSSAYVIFAELDWSPSVHRQAEDRLHRIGQKQKVFAHYLEGEGTFDEILTQVLLNKTVEINNVMGDKMEHMDNKRALEFLEERFKITKSGLLNKML